MNKKCSLNYITFKKHILLAFIFLLSTNYSKAFLKQTEEVVFNDTNNDTLSENELNNVLSNIVKDINYNKLNIAIAKSKLKDIDNNRNNNYNDSFIFVEDYIDNIKLVNKDNISLKNIFDLYPISNKKESVLIASYALLFSLKTNNNAIVVDIRDNFKNSSNIDSYLFDEYNNEWKAYVILISSKEQFNKNFIYSDDDSNNDKSNVIKICYSISYPSFFIKLNSYEAKCSSFIKAASSLFNSSNKSNNNSNTTIKSNEKKSKVDNSFIENSSNYSLNEVKDTEENKSFAFSELANKFSLSELSKIKSLIRFAKKNKILDKIYSKDGDVNIEDIANYNDKSIYMLVNNQSEKISSIENKLDSISKQLNDIISSANNDDSSINSNNNYMSNNKNINDKNNQFSNIPNNSNFNNSYNYNNYNKINKNENKNERNLKNNKNISILNNLNNMFSNNNSPQNKFRNKNSYYDNDISP